MVDSISDTAGFLAACVGSLDSLARGKFTADDELYEKCVEHTLRDFLDAFRSALKRVIPQLGQFTRADPVTHAGVSGTSYHEVVCRLALWQFTAIEMILNPDSYLARLGSGRESEFEGIVGDEITADAILNEWARVADRLTHRSGDVEPVDGAFLAAGLGTELTGGKTDPVNFVPNEFQSRILTTLAGRALKKQPLADKVCGGEGSRLYRAGGIKELKDKGLVLNRPRLGYYRPDSPPPS